MSAHWPPNPWEEADFNRDDETRLPTTLYPFEMCRLRDERDRPTGIWLVGFNPDRTERPKKVVGEFSDTFDAYEAMLAAYRAWFPNRPIERVYFIGTELRVGKMIKVGFSMYPEARLRTLQTSSPERLQIFATTPGGKSLEAKYHQRWSTRRRSGEWFVIGDCVIKEIERLQAQELARRGFARAGAA